MSDSPKETVAAAAQEILDQLLFEGTYTREVEIIPGLTAEFRVRSAKDVNSMNRSLGVISPSTELQAQTEMGLLYLSYSTTRFKDADLMELKPYPDRYEFFSKYPSPLVSAALKKLAEFDLEVEKALGNDLEDAVKNF